MTTRCSVILGSLAASACLALPACSVNSPNTTINGLGVTVSTMAGAGFDTGNVTPGEDVPVVATVQNVYLVDPASAPPPEHASDAGHLQLYLDDTTGTSLLITGQTTFNVKIPAETKVGNHNLICRVYKHDGTPTTAQVELSITVNAPGGTTCTTGTTGTTCTTGNTTCVTGTTGTTTCTTGNTTCTAPTGSTPEGPTTCTTSGTTTTCVTGTTTCVTTGA